MKLFRIALAAFLLSTPVVSIAHADSAHVQPSLREQAIESSLGFDSELRKLSDVMINTNGYSQQTTTIKKIFDTREANLVVLNKLRDSDTESAAISSSFTNLQSLFQGGYASIDTTAGSHGADRLVKKHLAATRTAWRALQKDMADFTGD